LCPEHLHDGVEYLFYRYAPGEECSDAPQRGPLGLDLPEVRIRSCAIS
jgi:hypothetical protein